MLKKILDKKIEQFKVDFPEYQISKKTGSFYFRHGVYKEKKSVLYTGHSLTKGTLSKIGTKKEWEVNKANSVFLLSQRGKLMWSNRGNNFSSVTLKTIRSNCDVLKNVFFIGKKYEWLKNHRSL